MAGEEKQGGGGKSDRVSSLKTRVDELARLNQQLAESRAAGRRIRNGLMIVLLIVILGFVLGVYSMAKNYDTTTFMAEVQARMLDPNSGTMYELIQVAHEVAPEYRAEFEKQFSAEWPKMQATLRSEGELFVKNVSESAEARVKGKIDAMVAQHTQRLQEAFPELKDEAKRDIVMKNLEKGFNEAVLAVLEGRADRAQDRLLAVQSKIVKFLPEQDQADFGDRMSRVWNHFLLVEMKGLERITP